MIETKYKASGVTNFYSHVQKVKQQTTEAQDYIFTCSDTRIRELVSHAQIEIVTAKFTWEKNTN